MEPVDPHHVGAGRLHRITISPAAIRPYVDLHARLGAAYGIADEQIIAEDTLNGHQLQVSLRQDTEGWALIVRGAPPLEAIVSLHADHQSRHLEFDAAGEARFSQISEAWLRTEIDVVLTLPGPPSP